MELVGCGAYILKHDASDMYYVGSTGDIRRRLNEHFSELARGKHHVKALQGLYNLDPRVTCISFFPARDREHAYQLEQTLLDKHLPDSACLNKALDAKRARLGLAHLEETKRKIGEAQIGEKNHQYGRVVSQEERERLSKQNTGYRHTDEARAKITQSKLGKPLSEAHKAKLADARTGTTHSLESRQKMSALKKGREVSPETRARMREAAKNRKPASKNGISIYGKHYPTQIDAAADLDMSVRMIQMRLDSSDPLYADYVRL